MWMSVALSIQKRPGACVGTGKSATEPRSYLSHHPSLGGSPPSRRDEEDQLTLAAPGWCNRTWLLAEPLCNREGEGKMSACDSQEGE